MSDFREFAEKARWVRTSKAPLAVITSNRQLYFNTASRRRLGDPTYVQVFVDEDRGLVGFDPLESREEYLRKDGTYKLPEGTMSFSAVLSKFDLDPPMERVHLDLHCDNGRPYIDLKEALTRD